MAAHLDLVGATFRDELMKLEVPVQEGLLTSNRHGYTTHVASTFFRASMR